MLLTPTCPQCPACCTDQAVGCNFCYGCGAAAEQPLVDPAQSFANVIGNVGTACSFMPIDGQCQANCQYEGEGEYMPVRIELQDNGLLSIKADRDPEPETELKSDDETEPEPGKHCLRWQCWSSKPPSPPYTRPCRRR